MFGLNVETALEKAFFFKRIRKHTFIKEQAAGQAFMNSKWNETAEVCVYVDGTGTGAEKEGDKSNELPLFVETHRSETVYLCLHSPFVDMNPISASGRSASSLASNSYINFSASFANRCSWFKFLKPDLSCLYSIVIDVVWL